MATKPPMHAAAANMRADAMGVSVQNGGHNPKEMLPTFIYDYFIKEKEFNLAQALLNSGLKVQVNKTSPKDVNGVDDDAKDEMQKRLDSLPRPMLQDQIPESPFLRDWWSLFWDLWTATRQRTNHPVNPTALAYVNQGMSRQSMMQGIMPTANMNAAAMRLGPGQMRNGAMEMRQAALANSSRPGLRQHMNPQQAAAQGQMQRDSSDMDLNGQRPQSPMSGGGGDNNEPSPKRPRTDGGPQMPGRQGMPMPGQMPNGIPPSSAAIMQGGFDAAMNGQFPGGPGAKPMQLYGMGKPGMPGHGPQGSPMIGPNGEMPASGDVASFQQQQQQQQQQQPQQRAGMQGNSQQGGALADYQMQLMLLEQQNKKRLLMARQEQDHLSHNGAPGSAQAPGAAPGGAGGNGGAAGAAMMAGGPGSMMAPGMSPHGSRTGHSPNNDQMKRGTPKMGQSSPLPDGSMPNRGSPAPGFEGGMPHNMGGNPMFMANKMNDGQMGPGGALMRPPNGMPFMGPNGVPMSQAQLDMLSRGRMPNGAWGGGPQMQAGQMMPQGAPQMAQGPQAEGAQRSQMPPPSAPAGGNSNNSNNNNNTSNNNNNSNGRAQPSPPSQTGGAGAPPTPSQASKPAPKKKDTKDSKKKGAQKKASANTGATPNSSAADHPEPTPSTPTIPVHPNSFTGPKAQGGPSSNAQSQAPAGQQVPGAGNGQDASAAGAQPFGALEQSNDMGMGMGMSAFESGDNDGVLEGFDFDSFLHMEETISFPEFDPSQLNFPADGVEMGAAEP